MSRDQTIVELFPTHGIVRGRLDPLVFKMAQELPDKKEWVRGQLHFALSEGNLNVIRQKLSNASWKHHHDSPRVKPLTERPASAINFNFARPPRQGQAEAFAKLKDLECGALFMDMGTGKSYVAIHLAAYWWNERVIDRVLLLAPNQVERQWFEEQLPNNAPKWYPWDGLVVKGNKRRVEKWIEERPYRPDKCHWLLMNIERMSHKSGLEWARSFVQGGKCLIIVDESTRIKGHKSGRTKNVTKLRESSHRRLILSGRPTTKGIEDLFAQYRFLDPDIIGTSSMMSFRSRYCIRGGYEMRQVVGYQHVDELLAKLEPHTFTMRKTSEYPPVYMRREHTLTDEQKRMYHELKEDLFVWVERAKKAKATLGNVEASASEAAEAQGDFGVACANAAVGMMRMLQVTCGYLPYKDPEDETITHVEQLSDRRAELTVDILDESGDQQALIFCAFHGCIDLVRRALDRRLNDPNIPAPDKWRYTYVEVSGRVKGEARAEALAKFKAGEVANMVGTAASGGIGLDLSMASVTIYYSNTNKGEDREQSKARTDRIGQVRYLEQKGVTYVDLIGSPVDTKIIQQLEDKKTIGDLVLSLDRKDLELDDGE